MSKMKEKTTTKSKPQVNGSIPIKKKDAHLKLISNGGLLNKQKNQTSLKSNKESLKVENKKAKIIKSRSQKKTPRANPPSQPLSDDRLGQIPGVPPQASIDEQLAQLSDSDRKIVNRIQKMLAQHLGSYMAARIWLTTTGTGFSETPLKAIQDGQSNRVLEILTAQWGRNPTYA
jgi:hypothetical protein